MFLNNLDPMKYKMIKPHKPNTNRKKVLSNQNYSTEIQNTKNFDNTNSISQSDKKVLLNSKFMRDLKNGNNVPSSNNLSNIIIQNIESDNFDSIGGFEDASRRHKQKNSKYCFYKF